MKLDGERHAWTDEYLFLNNRFIRFCLDESAFLAQSMVLLDRTRNLVTRTLKSVGMSLSDVQRMVLTGGASNAKYVHTYWQQFIDPARQKIVRHQPCTV